MTLSFRADHIGSLLRPQELLDARANHLPAEKLREIEDRHITRILARQRDLGLRIFSDGEFRRAGFMSDFHESVEGLGDAGAVARPWKTMDGGGKALGSVSHTGIVTRKIRSRRRLTGDQAPYLKKNAPGAVKMTLPTPNQFPAIAFKDGVSEAAYATRSEFLWDIVPLVRDEVQALLADGVDYIQIDAPRYSYYIDPKWRKYVQSEMHMDPEDALDEAIRADNACLEDARGRGTVIGMHLCRGNNRSQWYAEGGYDPIAEKLFAQLNVDVFLLEYETERAGTLDPLRFVPDDKGVVLGLLSSKVPELEEADQLRRRVEEAAKYIPLERLALSPQCGFASVAEGNAVTEDDQWRKLELVVSTARTIWNSA